MTTDFKIESLLSARLFLSPQLVGERIYFISDLSGRLSLYAMDEGGSVPVPLLLPDVALQNPALMGGDLFVVLPKLDRVLVMIDQNGDENYQPNLIPVSGGLPEPLFGDRFAGEQVTLSYVDLERNLAGFQVDHRTSPDEDTYLVDLESREITHLGSSLYGNYVVDVDGAGERVLLADGYTMGDIVLYLWERARGERRAIFGVPLDEREPGQDVPLSGLSTGYFVSDGEGLLAISTLFDDSGGLTYISLDDSQPQPVEVSGVAHEGIGELKKLKSLRDNRYLLEYNIAGVSWAYEGAFDAEALRFAVDGVLVGQGELSGGVLQHIAYEKESGDYVLAFSTATSPAQIYTLEGPERTIVQQTSERLLGVPQDHLAPGEDASFVSHDGLRISARLYLPAEALHFEQPYPVIFYVHGGPQGQERPDFTWFSMPLIQFLTLNGFAVFVPNVRGSTGYGIDYTKQVDRDWGGEDRLDHVAAFEHLREDPRLDMDRAGVMGRSYGGYMTLTQVGRHPDLWSAACDMFGPYNLFTFLDRLPETWKTYFYIALGHPEKDKEFLVERSPSTHIHNLACPLLVIQGRNDPRVRAEESEDLVRELQEQGKDVEILVMENEGHDVIKYENKVWIYNEIVDFFKKHLGS